MTRVLLSHCTAVDAYGAKKFIYNVVHLMM